MRSLSELIDARDYPALAAVQAAETADDHHLGDGDGLPVALSFGVDRFLDGIETWAHRDS